MLLSITTLLLCWATLALGKGVSQPGRIRAGDTFILDEETCDPNDPSMPGGLTKVFTQANDVLEVALVAHANVMKAPPGDQHRKALKAHDTRAMIDSFVVVPEHRRPGQ